MATMIAIAPEPQSLLQTTVTAPPVTTYRKSVYDLTADEVAIFRQAVSAVASISDNRGLQYIAGIHGYPQQYCQHGTVLFALWHRPYVLMMERALQARVPTAFLPYWDWASARAQTEGIPAIFTDPTWHNPQSGADESNPLLQQPIVQVGPPPRFSQTARNPGPPAGLSPLASLVDDTQRDGDYATYTSDLENPHNGLHGWAGGTMAQVPYAAFDPIFWAHHCNIERYLCDWQDANPGQALPPDLPQEVLAPFGVTCADVWDYRQLGYRYIPPNPGTLNLSGQPQIMADSIRSGATVAEFAVGQVPKNFERAELHFHEVHPPKESFELRVFINQPDANAATPTAGNPHYAGSYFFFGHGECTGDDASHCDVEQANALIPIRPPHHLSPITVRVNVSKPFSALMDRQEERAKITLVAVDNQGKQIDDPGLSFEALKLVAT